MCMFRKHKENWQMEEISSLVPVFVSQRHVGPLCVLPMTSSGEAGTKRLRTQELSVHLLHSTWQKCLNGWSFHGIAHFCSLCWWSSTSSENTWVIQNYQWWPAWLWDTQRQPRVQQLRTNWDVKGTSNPTQLPSNNLTSVFKGQLSLPKVGHFFYIKVKADRP